MAERLETPETLQAAIEFFSDPDRCHAYMVQMRWPDGVVTCPICNRPDPRYLAKQRRFECKSKHPRRQFSVKVGTIFEDSPIALKSWLLAVWQITNCKNGISSYELARALGVTQKTAWFMNHRIRLAMQGNDGGTLGFDGAEVEIDETYIGGKARNMRPRKKNAVGVRRGGAFAGKTVVMGLLERKTAKGSSRVKTAVIQNVRKHHLMDQISKNVADGAKVFTDALMTPTQVVSHVALDRFLVRREQEGVPLDVNQIAEMRRIADQSAKPPVWMADWDAHHERVTIAAESRRRDVPTRDSKPTRRVHQQRRTIRR